MDPTPRPPLFADRTDAGRALLDAIGPGRSVTSEDAVVVGLARGGIPVAAVIAAGLQLPLDAVAVRKIGHPLQPEYAIGAVVADGVQAPDGADRASARALLDSAELSRRLHRRRGAIPLDDRTVILVDDGVATGESMRAAIRWARDHGAARVVVAVPVAPTETARELALAADEVICPYPVDLFGAVSRWYRSFPQLDDAETEELMLAAALGRRSPT